jgi:hypothetical protein
MKYDSRSYYAPYIEAGLSFLRGRGYTIEADRLLGFWQEVECVADKGYRKLASRFLRLGISDPRNSNVLTFVGDPEGQRVYNHTAWQILRKNRTPLCVISRIIHKDLRFSSQLANPDYERAIINNILKGHHWTF